MNDVLQLMFFMPGFKSLAEKLKAFFQTAECPDAMRSKLLALMDGVFEVYEWEDQVDKLSRYGLGICLEPHEYDAWQKMRPALNAAGFCQMKTSEIGHVGNYFLLHCPKDRLIDDCAYYDHKYD